MSRQQTVGELKEKTGTNQSDRLTGGNLNIVYGLKGEDTLISKSGSSLDNLSGTVLVGGSSGDVYKLGNRAITIILDNGGSKGDGAIAKGLGLNFDSSYVAELEGKHLVAGDTESGQGVLLLNWKQKQHRIENFILADGKLSYRQLKNNYKTYGNYLGNYTLAKIERLTGVDLSALGLSSSSLDASIATISKRSTKLEKSRTFDEVIGTSRTAQVVGTVEDWAEPSTVEVSEERSAALYAIGDSSGDTATQGETCLHDLLPWALQDPLLCYALPDPGF
ncbi:MAG: hypothetical protein IGR76_16110 [Synechococcales cyanobacterium T60_A2020_003]|nr:hypothetical protein [Synechococcales cyanobacterium T60_A2020_003]